MVVAPIILGSSILIALDVFALDQATHLSDRPLPRQFDSDLCHFAIGVSRLPAPQPLPNYYASSQLYPHASHGCMRRSASPIRVLLQEICTPPFRSSIHVRALHPQRTPARDKWALRHRTPPELPRKHRLLRRKRHLHNGPRVRLVRVPFMVSLRGSYHCDAMDSSQYVIGRSHGRANHE